MLRRFDEPNNQAINIIRDVLIHSPIQKEKVDTSGPRSKTTIHLEGTLREVLVELAKVLLHDFIENRREAMNSPWVYDYYIETLPNGDVDVMTRLWNNKQGGSISYGRTIRRIGTDRYFLWVDD